ncbi:MAG: hypothetical protein H6828_14535, partial [Planctomycetes bacterium]|nr:hypothetical protein [Planctomycetota bacterium]
ASDAVYGEARSKKADPRAGLHHGRILAEPARLARRAEQRAAALEEVGS